MIEGCTIVEPNKVAEPLDWIAEGLSSVAFYLDPCLKGREPAEQAMDLFFQRFEKRMEKLEAQKAEEPARSYRSDFLNFFSKSRHRFGQAL